MLIFRGIAQTVDPVTKAFGYSDPTPANAELREATIPCQM